jgi:hypothetical protein
MSSYSIHFYDEYTDEGGSLGIVTETRAEAVRAVVRSHAELENVSPLAWTGDVAETKWIERGVVFTARYTLLRGGV